MTTLCIDFGNTRCKAALFRDGLLQKTFILSDVLPGLQQVVQEEAPTHSILSSVVHHDESIDAYLQTHTAFHRLTYQSRLPFTIPVGKPETVGADRLAIAAAAVHLFPQHNNLVISLGTCVTYNFINQQHELIGGAISPGMEMRFKAMHQFTARLPLAKGHWNVPLIGYDTVTNLQSGVVLGMAKELEGFAQAYAERFGNFNVLLTGGDTPLLVPHLKMEIFADPDLIFKGLYAICQYNHTA